MIDERWKDEVLSQREIDALIEQLIPGWKAPVMNILSDNEIKDLLSALSAIECDCKFIPEDEDFDFDEVLDFFAEKGECGRPLRYEDGKYYRFSFEDGLIPCDGMNDPENRIREK